MTGIKETTELTDGAFDALDLVAEFDDLNWFQIYSRVKQIRESIQRAVDGIELVPAEIKQLDETKARELGGHVAVRAHRFVQKVKA